MLFHDFTETRNGDVFNISSLARLREFPIRSEVEENQVNEFAEEKNSSYQDVSTKLSRPGHMVKQWSYQSNATRSDYHLFSQLTSIAQQQPVEPSKS